MAAGRAGAFVASVLNTTKSGAHEDIKKSMKNGGPCMQAVGRDELQCLEKDEFEYNKEPRSSSRRPTAAERAAKELLEYIKCDSQAMDNHKESEVANFYSGRSIFITGASGFVGKCLLEKILRSCPNVEQVYILIRPKRSLDVQERVEALVRSELFNRLRSLPHGREQLHKIVALKGDITRPLFGLTQRDIDLLSSKVSVVFHSAATVRFVEPLAVAVENNVVSVENLISLATKLEHLEALVHISTAYSNCDQSEIKEAFYDPPVQADILIEMARTLEKEVFEALAPTLIDKRPNTYTFTKAVAESLLRERSRKLLPNLPIAMVRPSIVGGVWQQPTSGWVDNFNGPTGVTLAMMSGAITTMYANPDYCADIVPVDIVVNLCICTAWEVHQQQHSRRLSYDCNRQEKLLTGCEKANDRITIFNCVSGPINPVNWQEFLTHVNEIARCFPCNAILDGALKLIGQKPRFVSIYKKLMKMVATLRPFTTNQWKFDCSNVTSLQNRMSPIDREIFNFDISQLRWKNYIHSYYVAAKMFVMKDDPTEVVEARRKLCGIRLVSRFAQKQTKKKPPRHVELISIGNAYILNSQEMKKPGGVKGQGIAKAHT